MKKKKMILPIILLAVMILTIATNVSYAAEKIRVGDDVKYIVGVKFIRNHPDNTETPYGYTVKTSDSEDKHKIWKFLTYPTDAEYEKLDDNTVRVDPKNGEWLDVYCLRADLGFHVPGYVQGGDDGTDENRETLGKLYRNSDNSRTTTTALTALQRIINNGENRITTETNSRHVLWILYNMYLRNSKDSEQKTILFSKMLEFVREKNEDLAEQLGEIEAEDIILTDNEIEVIQQLAIWHFTNPDNNLFNKETLPSLFQAPDENWNAEVELGGNSPIGQTKRVQAGALYYYLINNDDILNGGNFYNHQSNKAPKFEDLTSTVAIEGENAIVGPFKFNANSKVGNYEPTIQIQEIGSSTYKNQSNYTLLKSDKTTVAKIEELDGQEFYIKIPKTNISKVKLSLKIYLMNLNLWTATDTVEQTEQPIVIIEKSKEPVTIAKEVEANYSGSYSIVLVKEDATGEKLDEKATFEVDGVSTEVTGYLEIVQGKEITASTVGTVDTYTIKETVPPDKYCPFDGTIKIEVYKKQEGNKFVVDKIKYYVDNVEVTSNPKDLDVYLNTEGNIYVEVRDYQFDLALRKYITKINNVAVANTRVPNAADGINEGATTATYKHRKDPVEIKTGDKVTYNIAIYNEGEMEGRATEIVDQLPTGLKLVTEGEIESSLGNKYTIVYNSNSNRLRLQLKEGSTKNIEAYSRSGAPKSEVLEITCEVTAEAGKNNKVLTNIAWISKEYNSERKVEITNQVGQDRDSEPGTAPITIEDINDRRYADELVTSDNGYTGSGNKADLKDSNYYYKGQQDDDDFEKLILPAYKFDLSLRKFIVSVNGEELTGQKSRVPQVDVTGLKNGTSTTARYVHPKTPVSVQKGDIVIYTIRVYNEGDTDGYAEEITDYLPEGLGYIVNHKLNAENNWKLSETVTIKKLKDIPEAIKHLEDSDFDQEFFTTLEETDIVVGRTKLTTNKLDYKESEETNLIKAYDGGDSLSYKDIQIACVVISDSLETENLKNIAEITKAKDKDGNDMNETGDDRDSKPDTVYDDETYKPGQEDRGYFPGEQDDDDYENLVLKHFDLALRKFISEINDTEPKISREPVPVKNSENKIQYNHPKDPLQVKHDDLVTYTLRIFNEGSISGYAEEIKDHIPEGLQFVADNDTNKEYRWKMYKVVDGEEVETENEEEATIITTDYLSRTNGATNNLINAFDEKEELSAINPDYRDVKVVLKVTEDPKSERVLRNIAQISDDADEDGDEIDDIDSQPDNYPDEHEDDDDYDDVVLTYFDLALRKFITEIRTNDVIEKVDTRIPEVSYENGNIKYTHPKDPVLVTNGSIVTYTIRVFNEGKMAGYAEEVTDDLPEGLTFLPEDRTNKEYRWIMIDEEGNETDDVSKAVKITTDYLSKEQGEAGVLPAVIDPETGKQYNPNLIHAFDKNKEISENNPDYRDVKVAFRVTEEKIPEDRILINIAEISDDADENGNEVEDVDSIPGNNLPPEEEDDIDIEKVRVKYFDLSLLKYVSKVIVTEDGKTKVTETGYNGLENPEPMPKVEIKHNKLNSTTVKFAYTIKITNEGEIEGYATKITDDIPSGLRFVAEDNPNWTEVNGKIKTRALENTLLQPGESATVEVIFTWINDKNNMGVKTNTAEISEDKNEYGSPDIDSTPGNEKPGEDDIDIAKVILSIKTGKENIVPILIGSTIILAILAGGVVLIKKYVI